MTIGFLRDRLPGNRNGKARDLLRWVGSGAESLTEVLARTYFRMAGIHVEAHADVVYAPAKMVAQVLSVLVRGRKAWGGRAA
ncbi:hypothetical protein [Arthrobacter silvisoli]|uniref:hypothetical protein n=1 Tax=Arthrobacter silvisoli TaxID=2291022 RepID=UPI000E20EB3D|nr:hypothetical protein [Arthrobacter silvisoli]